jgi:uncharacterized protein YjdB
MKKSLLILCLLFVFTGLYAQTLEKNVLIDFGPLASPGLNTATPDANGNYWNNHNALTVLSTTALADTLNVSSGITLNIVTPFMTNGGSGAGGLTTPSATLLGNFAILNATQDYFFTQTNLNGTSTSTMKFTGLNLTKGYRFQIFGCRIISGAARTSRYTFTGATSTVGTLQTTGTDLGGTGIHGNISSIYSTPIIYADANGEIKLDLSIVTGGYAYINVMRIQQYAAPKINVTTIAVSGNPISTESGTSQMTATVAPTNATVQDVTWTVNDPSIAIINSAGLLTAKKNGTVTVTATTKEAGSAIYGTALIVVTNQPILAPIKQLFIDFGPNDATNGNSTSSQDINGNYWNNATDATLTASPVSLVDNTNSATGFSLLITAAMSKNGIVSGGLLSPNNSYLGEFAIPTATQDYFFTTNASTPGAIKMTGLDPNKQYKFRIFGSRDVAETRVASYTFTGSNTMTGTLQTSGTNLGGLGINGNNSSIFSSSMIYPNVSGEITVDLAVSSGSYAHLNIMKIEEYNVNVSGISVSGDNISANGGTSQMTATVSPINATSKTVTWKVSDTSVANINETGLLSALKNGEITVTATTTEAGSTISGSTQITISNQVTTSIDTETSSTIKITSDILNNRINITGAQRSVNIYNSTGTLIISKNASSQMVVNTNELKAGVYLLIVDKKSSFKIVK